MSGSDVLIEISLKCCVASQGRVRSCFISYISCQEGLTQCTVHKQTVYVNSIFQPKRLCLCRGKERFCESKIQQICQQLLKRGSLSIVFQPKKLSLSIVFLAKETVSVNSIFSQRDCLCQQYFSQRDCVSVEEKRGFVNQRYSRYASSF